MYEERGWLLRNPVFAVVVAVLLVVLAVIGREAQAWPFLVVPLGFVVLLMTANLRIQVDADRLSLRYFPFWRRTIELADITDARIVPYKWWLYGGWGIRLGFDGSISYSVFEPRAVRLTIAGRRHEVNIGTRRPEMLRDAIMWRAAPGTDEEPPRHPFDD